MKEELVELKGYWISKKVFDTLQNQEFNSFQEEQFFTEYLETHPPKQNSLEQLTFRIPGKVFVKRIPINSF